jgi:ribosomal-protein-alanine N-acetyltransferase
MFFQATMNLSTDRLTLRPQVPADAIALFTILGDPQAMRFWHRPPVLKLAVTEEIVREQMDAMARGICRYWTLFEQDDAIGSIDLSLIAEGSAELGFLLRRDCWGRGLASEAAAAVIAHAFGPLDLHGLLAAVQTGNTAAARVLEKNGFALHRKSDVTLPGGARADCAFYIRRR